MDRVGSFLAGWLLPFALVLYLGLKGGGYDQVVYGQVGIIAWWIVVLGAAVAVLPLSRVSTAGWVGFGLLAAFAAWTALGVGWSSSAERSVAELGRIGTYLGVFALALVTQGTGRLRRTVSAVGTAIAVVAIFGLLSRLHPAWFPGADRYGDSVGRTVASELPAELLERSRDLDRRRHPARAGDGRRRTLRSRTCAGSRGPAGDGARRPLHLFPRGSLRDRDRARRSLRASSAPSPTPPDRRGRCRRKCDPRRRRDSEARARERPRQLDCTQPRQRDAGARSRRLRWRRAARGGDCPDRAPSAALSPHGPETDRDCRDGPGGAGRDRGGGGGRRAGVSLGSLA